MCPPPPHSQYFNSNYSVVRRGGVCLLLLPPTPLHQLNLQRAGATIITQRISYFTPKESVCRELASVETACLNRETRVISKCLLLLANLDCRPRTVPSWLRCVLSTEQPEDWYSSCQLRRGKKERKGEDESESNTTLMYYFHLGRCHRKLRKKIQKTQQTRGNSPRF